MKLVHLKVLTVIFGIGVAGVAVSLGMSVFLAVQDYQAKQNPPPLSVPTPALPS